MKFLIDLDGTLLVNNSVNLDAVNFMNELNIRCIDYMIMTNSIASPTVISNRLKNVGISVSSKSILNPIVSINSYISSCNISNAYIVGSVDEIQQVCVPHEQVEPEIILLLDFEKANVGYKQLQTIYQLIEKNIPILSASGSLYYLNGQNKRIDTGAFVSMFESLSKSKISVFGKPSKEYFNQGLQLLNSDAENTIVIGDDWRTDIVGAKGVGCFTVLVQSGKYQQNDELKADPDLVVSRLVDIFNHSKFL